MATVGRINTARMLREAATSSNYRTFAEQKAAEVKEAAQGVFNARQRHDNSHRTSETTPPKYLESFSTQWEGQTLFLINDDPASMWVEFGAHAGGETPVLKYRPMTIGMDIVVNREGA